MLPVLICESDEALRALILDALRALQTRASLKLISADTSYADAARHAEALDGVSLAILGLALKPNTREAGLKLGQTLMRRSRDNYTVYCVHELTDLDAVLAKCDRPAGILLPPLTREKIVGCLSRIADEHAALAGEDAADSCLTLNSGSTTWRVPFDQITCIEALDKKLSLYTQRQTITLRAALGSLIDKLPPQFVRCHRSYVVNIHHVRQTDYANMTLTLSDDTSVPISRSNRSELKEKLDELEART